MLGGKEERDLNDKPRRRLGSERRSGWFPPLPYPPSHLYWVRFETSKDQILVHPALNLHFRDPRETEAGGTADPDAIEDYSESGPAVQAFGLYRRALGRKQR